MSELSVYNELRRPRPDIVDGFRALLKEYSPSCLVADARQRRDVLGGLRPVRPEHRVAGPVLTVDFVPDDLVDCPTVVLRARPGDIVLLAGHGQTECAMWGGLMSTLAIRAGVAATVVDGAVRDVDEIRDLDYPLWYRGIVPKPSPTAVHGRTEPVRVNVPVVVGGQTIEPGDILVADENGLAVVPFAQAADALAATRALVAKENAIRDKLAAGISPAELLAEFGHV
jgi:4-hydroxy-4-methyl-2-oxoglutarate aldolase